MAIVIGTSRGGVKSDINVTPLVDVCLVLLIIFMVVTPLLQRGKDVTLPRAKDIDAERQDAEPIVLSVTSDHQLWLDKTLCTEETLEAQLRTMLQAAPEKQVMLKGDASLAYGDIRRVMKIAEKVKSRGVQLAVEELKER
jgi:biopolymer transport protein ExbD